MVEFPEYDGNSMYRAIGDISRNPNVGLLFVKFDGQTYRVRINGRAEILDDTEPLARHHAAKLVIRAQCELYPNCPRAVHDIPNDRQSVCMHHRRPSGRAGTTYAIYRRKPIRIGIGIETGPRPTP